MFRLVELTTVFLYLLPVLVLWTIHARKEREIWELALDVPLALSVDYLLMVVLARAMTLEAAAWAMRGAWLAVGIGFAVRDRNKPIRVLRTGIKKLGASVLAACAIYACVYVSTSLSREWGMWDRGWQDPLVASVRGQTAPFMNVYQPDVPLHYHYTGVALASVLQALSFDSFHGSFALSLLHDIYFGLIGLTVAGLLHAIGLRRWWVFVLVVLAVILDGPITAYRGQGPERGYAFLNYVQMSFRPYIAVAGLLFVGIVGSVFVRLEGLRRSSSPWRTLPTLVASFLLLAITEEPSAAILGLGLGAAWLVHEDAIHPNRWIGLAALVPMAASIPYGARLYQTSLAAQGTVGSKEITPWRMPGFELPPLPLSTEIGRRVFYFEFLPIMCAMLALAITVFVTGSRRRGATFALIGVTGLASILLVLRVELNHYATDAHRFVIAASFVCPLGIALVLVKDARHGFASAVAIGGMALGAHSTLGWIDNIWRSGADPIHGGPDMHAKSCRDMVGPSTFEHARPTYVAATVFWPWVGCRPTFIAGTGNTVRVIKTEAPQVGPFAIRELDAVVAKPGMPLQIVCSAADPDLDPVCRYAIPKSRCRTSRKVLICELPADARAGLPGR